MARSTKSTALATIDRVACRTIETAALAELQSVAARLGLRVRAAGGKFGASAFTMRVEFTLDQEVVAGVPASREADAYRMNCTQFGLAPEWLGKSFDTPRGKLTIIGLAPRRAKCVMLRDDANQRFSCLPSLVQKKLATTESRAAEQTRLPRGSHPIAEATDEQLLTIVKGCGYDEGRGFMANAACGEYETITMAQRMKIIARLQRDGFASFSNKRGAVMADVR